MKICVATGSRADYGLLKPLLEKINNDPEINLQLIVTGAHLSPEFGLTYKQIESDGFSIGSKVEMLLSSDTAEGITKSMGLGMIGFADAFKYLKPDLLIILGDRYEMLSVASTALIFRIPIAHIHGGEITEGAYDDSIRHSITKMSHLHFTSTETYLKRVIQLGEQPERVFNVGAIGLDNFQSIKFRSKEELEKDLNIRFDKYNYLVSFHSETLSDETVEQQLFEIIKAIDSQENSFFIFTKTNADTDGRIINDMISKYVKNNTSKAAFFSSLGTLYYLSIMKYVTAIIGNSSSGIVEAPTAKTATINVGQRQKGRIQASSIINCNAKSEAIIKSIDLVKDPCFRKNLVKIVNPYGNGTATTQIYNTLKTIDIKAINKKKFYDLI